MLLIVLLLVDSLYVDVICILYASHFGGCGRLLLLGYAGSLVCLCIVILGFGFSCVWWVYCLLFGLCFMIGRVVCLCSGLLVSCLGDLVFAV